MTKQAMSLVMRELCRYVTNATRQPLPTHVAIKAKHHLADTLSWTTLGTLLMPGRKAVDYARRQCGAAEVTVAGTDLITSTVNEAFANGMNAHADETEDTHFPSCSHLRCGVVPAALAMAEKEARYGRGFWRWACSGTILARARQLRRGAMKPVKPATAPIPLHHWSGSLWMRERL